MWLTDGDSNASAVVASRLARFGAALHARLGVRSPSPSPTPSAYDGPLFGRARSGAHGALLGFPSPSKDVLCLILRKRWFGGETGIRTPVTLR